ncbi:MAG: tyrosine-type recombinase/integrase [Paracoccaceae bacterium]
MTFGDAWDQYHKWCVASGKTKAALKTFGSYGKTIQDIPHLPVATTSLAALQRWRDSMVNTPVGGSRRRTVSSVAKATSALKTALRRAGVDGDWQKMRPGVKKSAGQNVVALMGADAEALLGHISAQSAHMGAYAKVLAATGARPSEIAQVRVADFTGTTLRIRQGKTGARTVPLSPTAITLLRTLAVGRPKTDLLTPDGQGHRPACGDTL